MYHINVNHSDFLCFLMMIFLFSYNKDNFKGFLVRVIIDEYPLLIF